MKGLIERGAPALLVAIVASSLALPVAARPPITSGNPNAMRFPVSGETPMMFNFSAPFITSSGVRGSSHFIRLAIVGMSVKDLMIFPPKQMKRYNSVRVINQNGQEVPSKITAEKDRVAIVFDQVVPEGSYLEVVFTGVEMPSPLGETLLYRVTAERTGLIGEIPVGTARVQIPDRS